MEALCNEVVQIVSNNTAIYSSWAVGNNLIS